MVTENTRQKTLHVPRCLAQGRKYVITSSDACWTLQLSDLWPPRKVQVLLANYLEVHNPRRLYLKLCIRLPIDP